MDCPQSPIILVLGETTPPKNIAPWNEKKERPLLVILSPNANVKRQRQAFGTFGSDASLLVTLWIVHGWCRCSGIHGRPWHGAVCSMASTGHLETWNQNDLITQLPLIGTQKTTVESKSTNWSTEEFWENVQLRTLYYFKGKGGIIPISCECFLFGYFFPSNEFFCLNQAWAVQRLFLLSKWLLGEFPHKSDVIPTNLGYVTGWQPWLVKKDDSEERLFDDSSFHGWLFLIFFNEVTLFRTYSNCPKS